MKQQERKREKQPKQQKRQKNDIYENKQKGLRNKETNMISIFFIGLFLIMGAYLVYFNVSVAPNVINNPYNKRIDNQSKKIIRGDILAADGSVIATTKVDDDGNEKRFYPYDALFSQVIGLTNAKTGIEGLANYELLSRNDDFIQQIIDDLSEEKTVGNTVVTTLDPKLQKAAYDAIGSAKGAVICMEPSTGKVLVMVSKPDYNPNKAITDYNSWLELDSADSVLLNRATQGLYPPGSTFKILTALEYVRENSDFNEYTYECSGSAYAEGGTTIPCNNNKKHGTENLKDAFAYSCNSAFSSIGLSLNKKSFRELCEKFQFNRNLEIGIESNPSSFVADENSGVSEMQETSIGQGRTMITPIHNLMIAAAVANGGTMMKPYFITEVKDSYGNVLKEYAPSAKADVISLQEANIIKEYMRAVTEYGTGSSFYNVSYDAAGKTGTAQYGDGKNAHMWFTGFAPYDNPEIAVCVILEGGSSSKSAQQVAKKVFDKYFE